MPEKSLRQFPKGLAALVGPDLENRLFTFSLILSVCLHLASCAVLLLRRQDRSRKTFQKIEVVYQAVTASLPEAAPRAQETRSLKEGKLSPTPQVLTKKETGPASMMKELMKSPSKVKLHSKQPAKINLGDTKRHVYISSGTDKIMNPQYIGYEDSLRRKISSRAHSYVDNPEFEVGVVQLTFVLLADGSLKEVKIIDEKTKANDYLRSISLRSIKESAPFSVFPDNLKYPELTFSVEISYEEN